MRYSTFVFVFFVTAFAGSQLAQAQDAPSPTSDDASNLIVPSVQGVPKIFLPDIGIAGDFAYSRDSIPSSDPRYSSLPQQPGLRDGQFIANSRIDPFTDAQLSIDLPNGGGTNANIPNVEEAWVYFNKLPAGVALKVGRYKPRFGLLDESDTFQLPMFDRPRAIADYLGDGLSDNGAQVDFVVPTPGDINLKAYLSVGRGDMLGATLQNSSAVPLTYLATLDFAHDVFNTGSLEIGASAAQGPCPYGGTELLIDPYFQLELAPSQRQIVTWSAEGMFAQRQDSTYASSRQGFYTFLDYNFALFYHLGFLVDWVQAPGPLTQQAQLGIFPDAYAGAPTDGSNTSFAPNFSWFVSDNTRLRIQYTHTTAMGSEKPIDEVDLQATFSMGNLKQLD